MKLSDSCWLRQRKLWIINTLTILSVISILFACSENKEPTKASSSVYNQDIRKATTSEGLSKADLAWHAQNTYGWDCPEVVSKGEMTAEGYFFIECSSGKKFRVYPRTGQQPKITNENGGYN